MAQTNTDLTEEDAADLQFPKDGDQLSPIPFSSINLFDSDGVYCGNCLSEVTYEYILCAKCNVNICLDCFSKGAEFHEHKNDHNYRILTMKFVLFENSDWTAKEELILLDSMLNYGNWNLVAQELPNKSIQEIMDHYEYFYLDRKACQNLPVMPKRDEAVYVTPSIPYRMKMDNIDDPPRYLTNSLENTIGYQSLAGYNPARSDFENEYDKNAEDVLSTVEVIDEEDPCHDMLANLQCALVNSYNRHLKERERWKEIIRNHGLLLLRKTISWLHRYDMTITKPVYEKLVRFMQFCDPDRFVMFMEGLHRAGELRIHIARLIQLRKKGITSLAEGKLYLRLKQIHDEQRKSVKNLRTSAHYNWKNTSDSNLEVLKFKRNRSVFTPIDIIGMPGYHKLSEKEKELCKNVRLVPATYFTLRDVLIAEQKRCGHVKLQTARRLLKIDVNKTRKLYDFLIQEGFISKE